MINDKFHHLKSSIIFNLLLPGEQGDLYVQLIHFFFLAEGTFNNSHKLIIYKLLRPLYTNKKQNKTRISHSFESFISSIKDMQFLRKKSFSVHKEIFIENFSMKIFKSKSEVFICITMCTPKSKF